MQNSPYRGIENPPEEAVLERFRELFSDKDDSYDTKYVASNSYGFGYISATTDKQKDSEAETNEYKLKIGQGKKPLTITLVESPIGITIKGFEGWESAGEKLNHTRIQEIINEIQLSKELTPTVKISGQKETRARYIRKIIRVGNVSGHSTFSNVTKNGFVTIEKQTNGNCAIFLIDQTNKEELLFFVNGEGEITKITKLIGRAQVHSHNLDIHRIHSTYHSGDELKAAKQADAIKRLDENLETFKLPFVPEDWPDVDEVRSGVRKKLDNVE